MILKLLPFLKWLIPPREDATNGHLHGWRWAVAVTAVCGLFIGMVGLGWVPKLNGYAYAEDIDNKIENALKPVNDRLESIETSQTAQGNYLTRLVKSDIAQDIHAEKIAWCRADTSQEKQRLREKLDQLQDEYEEAAGVGKHATEPDCE